MKQNDDPPSEHGGHAFQALVEANCRVDYSKEKKDDELFFERKQEPYDRCERRYQCEQ